jgi:hypothetical protein
MNEINFVINLTTLWTICPYHNPLPKGKRVKTTDPSPLPCGERVRVRGK